MAATQIISSIESIDTSSFQDESNRKQAITALKDAIRRLETPHETVFQWMAEAPMNIAACKIAIDLKLFEHLDEDNGSPKSSKELAERANAELELVERVLRHLAAVDVVKQNDKSYAPTNLSSNLTQPGPIAQIETNIYLFTHLTLLPKHLKTRQSPAYSVVRDPGNTVIGLIAGREMTTFEYLHGQPDIAKSFGVFMAEFSGNRPGLWEKYPVEANLLAGAKTGPDDVLFIDVGGSTGHDCRRLVAKFPSQLTRPGSVVVEDLAIVTGLIDDHPVVTAQTYDFFTPQPIIGARAYHFRNIMHDWNDDDCVNILTNTAAAMEPGYSKILIHELYLHGPKVSAYTTTMDLSMMAFVASRERTDDDWHALVGRVPGLRITGVYNKPGLVDCVVEIEKVQE